ncbi:MAG: hypothetical protein ACM3YE_13675 [Bacteroidota bacterium]
MAVKAADSQVSELNLPGKKIALLLTIYERLADRYFIRAKILDYTLLVASIVICLASYVDPKILGYINVTSEKSFILLGSGAFVVFAISVFSFISNWKAQAADCGRAAEILNRLKAECNEKAKTGSPEENKQLQIKAIEYFAIINNLPKIPQKEFHKLKTLHKRRLELDRMIELYPGSSVWLLKFVIHLRANLHVLLRKPVVDDSIEEIG